MRTIVTELGRGLEAGFRLAWLRFALPSRLASLPFDAVVRAIGPAEAGRSRAASSSPVPRPMLASMRVVERVTERFGVPSTCLYRALARYAALRYAGIDARFVMGIRCGQPELVGHAWVEIDGRAWNEHLAPDLVESYCYPPRGPDAAPATEQDE